MRKENYMKKQICFVLISVFILMLCACSDAAYEEPVINWDCTVSCVEASGDESYIITYSNQKISSKTGTFTIQNPNDFTIVVHLSNGSVEERVCRIAPGGTELLSEVEKDSVYTVGSHAEVEAGTEIKLKIHDGEYRY